MLMPCASAQGVEYSKERSRYPLWLKIFSTSLMKMKKENPNDHKRVTPHTKGDKSNDRKFTSYDTSRQETATPQKVRETKESAAEHARSKSAKGKQ